MSWSTSFLRRWFSKTPSARLPLRLLELQCLEDRSVPSVAVSINDVSLSEGNIGPTAFTFSIKATGLGASTATVNYTTADNTATAGSDYPVGQTGTLTLVNGDNSLTILVNGDTTPEPNETFFVNLSNLSTGTLDDSQGVGAIVNDDNAAPVAADGTLTAAEDTTTTGTLVATDADSPTLTYSVVDDSNANGVVTITNAATGAYSYAPDLNYNGTGSFFTFKANDGALDSNVATISLTVTQVNDSGTFGGDTSGSGAEDGAITGTLTFADPADGATAPNFQVTIDGTDGSAVIDSGTGAWSYTPNPNFNGTDSFTVSVTDDDGNTETQLISLTVTQVNDPGTFGGDTSGSGPEDGGAITGTLTFADAADGASAPGFSVTAASVNGTATINSGTGAWSYSPAANFNGTDSFTVSVTDDDGNTETQLISITVTQVNDAGTFAGDTSGTGAEDGGAITGTLTFADPADGATAPNFQVTTPAVNGAATINALTGAWNYTPNPDFNGSDSFTVSVTDDDGNTETQLISITVTAVDDAPVNDFPVAVGDNVTTAEDTPVSVDLAANDTPSDDGGNVWALATSATNGTAVVNPNGTFSYTPDADFNGSDTFTYTITDIDGDVSTATVDITVSAVNDAPVAADRALTAAEDTPTTGTLVATDADSPTLIYSIVDQSSANGVVTITNAATGAYSYAPDLNFNGPASFTFQASDGALTSNVATVSITVTQVNDAGTFGGNTSGSGPEDGGAITGTLTFADPADGASAPNFQVTTPASNGTATINAGTGAWSYSPAANFNGTDSFTVSVTDDDGNVETQVISLTVTAVDDFPVAVDDVVATTEDTPASGTLAANDTPSGDTGNVWSLDTQATNGTAVVNANGTFSYTPNANFNGSDTFTYTITDVDGDTDTATVSITVAAVNDAPVVNNQSFTVTENSPNGTPVGSVLATDVDGPALTYSIIAGNTAGAFAINPVNGQLTVANSAALDFETNPVFSLTVQVSDGTATDTAVVTIALGDVVEAAPPLPPPVVSAPLSLYAVGTGPGVQAQVNVYDAISGALRFSLLPYGAYTGGVTVAMGDVTGDGTLDVVTVAAGHVKVFDGTSGAEVRSFLAYGGYSGEISVAVGDLNGDTQADIVTGASINGHVKAFDGATGAEIRSFFAYAGFPGAVTVAAGDVNHDGTDDIITGAGQSGHVKVFDGISGAEVRSFFAYAGFPGAVNVAAGDVNGDGWVDIITGAGAGAGPHVKVFSGADNGLLASFFAYGGFDGGVRVGSADLDGDLMADILTGAGPSGGPHVKGFDGLTAAELDSFFAFDPSFTGGIFVGGK